MKYLSRSVATLRYSMEDIFTKQKDESDRQDVREFFMNGMM